MIKMGSQAVVHRESGDFRLKGNRYGNKSCTYTVRSTVILILIISLESEGYANKSACVTNT